MTADDLPADPIRIHLGPMPEMLRTFIEDLLSLEGDILVVGHSDQEKGVLQYAREMCADMLITQVSGQGGQSTLDVVLSAAPVKIFAIGADGMNAEVVNLTRHDVPIEGNSQSALGQAIRRAAHNVSPSSQRAARWLG